MKQFLILFVFASVFFELHASHEWMGLLVRDEPVTREGYDRSEFGSPYRSLEDEIIASLPQIDGHVYAPYTCTLFDIEPDGTAATDIEHIVALAEAFDSGLAASDYMAFAGDLENLTIAGPRVNRIEKSDRDSYDWKPPRNRGWFAHRVIVVKQKYGLSIDVPELFSLASMLAGDPSGEINCP